MANTLQTSINWSLGFLGYSTPTVGPNNEPALSSANMVSQVMLSPPFRFPWNRNKVQFSTVAGTQDYTVAVTDFGYLETATFKHPTTGKILPLNIKNVTPLGESADSQQPITLAVQNNTVGTNVVFRFLGVPNAAYTVVATYQKAPVLMTTPSSGWAPIPDYLSHIYNRGFLAHCLEGVGSPRAAQEKIAFAAALLSTAEGLTETEQNIFLAQYLLNPRMFETVQLKTQQGIQARGQ